MFVEKGSAKHATVRFRHWSFDVSVPAELEGEGRREAIRRAFVRWYRSRAQHRLASAVSRWSKAMGCEPRAVLTRDQRQRWGSCATDGTVRFNWRIVMAEPWLIDYVVTHELLHLRIRTHSREYWDEMARVMPDYRLRRARLKDTGSQLSL
jgi:predicted metal-dependent hydrolase